MFTITLCHSLSNWNHSQGGYVTPSLTPTTARPQAHGQPFSFPSTAARTMSLPKTVFPFPLLYGTIEFDHIEMVRGFKDPEADEAVGGIVGKKYLVWLHLVRLISSAISLCHTHTFQMSDLLASREDPCPYSVDIVAQSPRRVDDIRGLTAKMFVPIFPNADPDLERPSVYPIGPTGTPAPFPRGDCAHWTDAEVRVAFMCDPEGLDNDSAYRLPCEGMSLIRATYSKDQIRVSGAQTGSLHPLANGTSSQVSDTRSQHGRESSIISTNGAAPTEKMDGSHNTSIPDTLCSEDDPFNSDFIPLTTISLDIGWISRADSLPDVYDFFRERDQIQR